ncbi:MAG TPA: N,N-dimethylformamidase beta subunit family domain-containing protein, partial [Planctomycetota bacterium]|nr:N,N-dimethylformamidase beta subunit family domain-containing protein [Planctomycetota bacterium]
MQRPLEPRRESPTRRDFIIASASAAASLGAGASLLGSQASTPGAHEPSPASPDLIRRENEREGALDWQLTRVRVDGSEGVRSRWIEGYASQQSLAAGDTLDLFVSTNPPVSFTIEIFRMGYYAGRGARLMTTLGPFAGETQPDPPVGPKRIRECAWEPCASLEIPSDWPSGVYLGRLTTRPESPSTPYWQSYIIFVVRDARRAAILFQVSDNTWQAYNQWPGGFSLYTDPRGAHALDVAVSFDRPYGLYPQIFRNPQSVGSGEFLLWEYPLAFWLEEHGYDVTYVSNRDVLDASQITRAKTFLSVGHDEYWDL